MPELNHYRINTFNKLSLYVNKLTILKGKASRKEGHTDVKSENILFDFIECKGGYNNFGYKIDTYTTLLRIIKSEHLNIVLTPLERKNILLILFLAILKRYYNFKLVSYNHDFRKIQNNKLDSWINRILYKMLMMFYDRIIFYTEKGMRLSIENGLISENKAGFANNTIDTNLIFKNYYSSNIDTKDKTGIIFIGRIVERKKLDVLFDYFKELKEVIQNIRLYIIGDGPLLQYYRETNQSECITFLGSSNDEGFISKYMNHARMFFCPNDPGLAIQHSFAYGVPFVTFDDELNAPETDYLKDNYNCKILKTSTKKENINWLKGFFKDELLYKQMSENSQKTAENYSLERWIENILHNFTKLI